LKAFPLALILFVCTTGSTAAQEPPDTRTQYPWLLQNSYISINVGAIDQPFSQAQLEPGFRATSIDVPRVDVRVMLIGHEFNRFLSAQASYMRPLNYVSYASVRPGDADRHHVRVNFGAVTLKARVPVARRWSAYGESRSRIHEPDGLQSRGHARGHRRALRVVAPRRWRRVSAHTLLGSDRRRHVLTGA
jgi:hypothetical protein